MNPVLYDISSPKALVEFDHPGYFNSCTMKSGTFGAEDLVFSGNDFWNLKTLSGFKQYAFLHLINGWKMFIV